jgi:hypothetical protein
MLVIWAAHFLRDAAGTRPDEWPLGPRPQVLLQDAVAASTLPNMQSSTCEIEGVRICSPHRAQPLASWHNITAKDIKKPHSVAQSHPNVPASRLAPVILIPLRSTINARPWHTAAICHHSSCDTTPRAHIWIIRFQSKDQHFHQATSSETSGNSKGSRTCFIEPNGA